MVTDVEEISNRRYEIGALIPSVYGMFGFDQGNSVHQYDLWEHCLNTVLNLPKDVDDDMLYLAAMLHDVGKPECMCCGKDENDNNLHYYGHPQVSMEIVRDEVIPCLEKAGAGYPRRIKNDFFTMLNTMTINLVGERNM